jgi:SAM-dependent methyltransferase
MLQPDCRSCGRRGIETILSFGRVPLANRLVRQDQLGVPEPRYPLDVAFCPACALVQLAETVAPAILFHEYPYHSSFADTMLQSSEALVARLIRERCLGPESLALEIGSNDGYLLQFYRRAGIPALGIDPAVNLARLAWERRAVQTIAAPFDGQLARSLVAEGRRADVLHANNVLAHVPNVNDVVNGIGLVLADDGVAAIETPYVRDLVQGNEFDTIYHEHVFYYSLTALMPLFRRHDLVIQDVEHLTLHGGSLRLFVGRAGRPSERVEALLVEERTLGLDRRAFYDGLATRAELVRTSLRSLLATLRQQGQTIAAYGAAAKGAMLLSYCGLGTETLEYVVDRNPAKHGTYLPGARLPIFPPERLLETCPAYLLILAWNFAGEIVEQQAEYRAGGGQFIVPIPTPRIVRSRADL